MSRRLRAAAGAVVFAPWTLLAAAVHTFAPDPFDLPPHLLTVLNGDLLPDTTLDTVPLAA